MILSNIYLDHGIVHRVSWGRDLKWVNLEKKSTPTVPYAPRQTQDGQMDANLRKKACPTVSNVGGKYVNCCDIDTVNRYSMDIVTNARIVVEGTVKSVWRRTFEY